jgi:lipopolysaccharide transport system permease protein
MRRELLELWKYRELLALFVERDLKVRYKNSVLGFGWSLINPLVQVLTLTFVLLRFMAPDMRTENYHAYVFCGMVPWLFFNTALLDSANALIGYQGLLRKTYFPREILPLAVVIANFIHLLLTTAVLLAYLTANSLFWWAVLGKFNFPLSPTVFLIPIPMLGLALLVTGLAMFISVWTLYYEDVRFILDSMFRVLYWVVPVLYFGEAVLKHAGRAAYTAYMLNPLSGLITAFRKLTLVPTKFSDGQVVPAMGVVEWGFVLWALAISAGMAYLGFAYFNKRKWALAERA